MKQTPEGAENFDPSIADTPPAPNHEVAAVSRLQQMFTPQPLQAMKHTLELWLRTNFESVDALVCCSLVLLSRLRFYLPTCVSFPARLLASYRFPSDRVVLFSDPRISDCAIPFRVAVPTGSRCQIMCCALPYFQ
jgi:hypothetical protein